VTARFHLAVRIHAVAQVLAPPRRREWFVAMRAELEAVAPHDELDFALGCLRVSIEERTAVMNLPLRSRTARY
jgi:hypothetical protein